jgi:hypothetical protein
VLLWWLGGALVLFCFLWGLLWGLLMGFGGRAGSSGGETGLGLYTGSQMEVENGDVVQRTDVCGQGKG